MLEFEQTCWCGCPLAVLNEGSDVRCVGCGLIEAACDCHHRNRPSDWRTFTNVLLPLIVLAVSLAAYFALLVWSP